MDSQTLELIGKHMLASELLQAGLEVAFPARDRGVDLIAYVDINAGDKRFIAKPIQMKAASKRSFGIYRKYERIHDLILAFVWNVDGHAKPETYALTYEESCKVGAARGWLETASWKDNDGYGTTRPGKELRRLLEPYRMTPDAWRIKVTGSPR